MAELEGWTPAEVIADVSADLNQEAAAAAGLARIRSPSEKVHPETHGQNRPAAEAILDPFTVAPAHPGDIADDPEKNDRNENPLLLTQKMHG